MKKRSAIQRQRILYIGPIGAGVLGACGTSPLVALGLALDWVDSVETALGLVLAVSFSFVTGAWLFNMVGPFVGGLHVWSLPPKPRIDSHAPVIVCPQCGAENPRGRSFCAECGHDFEPTQATATE